MIIISEELARELVTLADAIESVESCFIGMARGTARNYPVVRENLGLHDAVFGVKTGCEIGQEVLGLKAGGYWPHNSARGVGNHQSSTLLFDAGSGRASALVSANYLTGARTGASSAIATKYLSRKEASVLGLIGTGGQSEYQLRATMEVRQIGTVHAWDPVKANLDLFGETVRGLGLEFFGHAAPKGAVASADIVITVTPSQAAILETGWVRPGTHISAMGADTKGKQEIDPDMVAGASLFYDELGQVQTIGEYQHAFAQGLIQVADLKASIGEVAAGLHPGRAYDDEITIYDGTGVALQDLIVADLAVKKAQATGRGVTLNY